MTRKNFFCIVSYDKRFCIKSWQTFANLFFLYEVQVKKRLSRCPKKLLEKNTFNHFFFCLRVSSFVEGQAAVIFLLLVSYYQNNLKVCLASLS